MIIAQYLEPDPQIDQLDVQAVRERLHRALHILPVTAIAIGWNLAPRLHNACAEVAAQSDIQLYRWQPLLTDDGELQPDPAWRTIGLSGMPIPGFQGMPEFTFICPNQPAARQAVRDRIRTLCRSGDYHGIFFDRMRFPSPAHDPFHSLACFCHACYAEAARQQIDLEAIQYHLTAMAHHQQQAQHLVTNLLARPDRPATPADTVMETFLNWRCATITSLIAEVATICHAEGQSVGLDCFSPRLARMVGQDLAALAAHAEWSKIMSYGHTLGPAGIPFELLGLARWLIQASELSESAALSHLGAATGFQLPDTLRTLEEAGISSEDLAAEATLGMNACVQPLLFGIELVNLPEITWLNTPQITADLRAIRQSGVDGLALSWDLWHIPPEHLALVRAIWSRHSSQTTT